MTYPKEAGLFPAVVRLKTPNTRNQVDAVASDAASACGVLLIEPDAELSPSRLLLLELLGTPVHLARNLTETCNLRNAAFCLVTASATSNHAEMQSLLTSVRKLWPDAAILLLGDSAFGVEDHQYDEIVNAAHHPADLVSVARRLISKKDSQTRE